MRRSVSRTTGTPRPSPPSRRGMPSCLRPARQLLPSHGDVFSRSSVLDLRSCPQRYSYGSRRGSRHRPGRRELLLRGVDRRWRVLRPGRRHPSGGVSRGGRLSRVTQRRRWSRRCLRGASPEPNGGVGVGSSTPADWNGEHPATPPNRLIESNCTSGRRLRSVGFIGVESFGRRGSRAA